MARSSKRGAGADQTAARPAPARRTVRRARTASEAVAVAKPTVSDQAELSDVESPSADSPAAEPERMEASAVAPAPTELPAVEPPVPDLPEPVLLVEAVEPAPAEALPDQPGPRALPGRLHGIGLGFWQAQLERTMATGQAILVCRSPEAAVRLQIAYVQATLASGIEHAGQLARLSQEVARDMLPRRPR